MSTQPPAPHSGAGDTAPPADDVAAPPPSGEAQPLSEEDTPATAGSPPEPVSSDEPADDIPDTAPRSQREVVMDELRYWRRTAVLGVIAGALYALTRWDQSRIPTSRRPRTGSR
ncbi:MAG: hypothetical protein OXU67_09550, partial [Chloroflexota bacterium]|nr:hypothetical protein [Chloroflexota bacterium]